MKRILGLDLGSASIGWAIIEENSIEVYDETTINSSKDKIIALGSRIIPLSNDESSQFSKGQAITKNADRTAKRTQRKGYDRYQLRRKLLLEELSKLGMYNGTTLKLSKLDLWGTRAKAIHEKITLLELGRVLCHINQRRGYKTSKSDFGDKKTGEYVSQVVERYRELHEQGLFIGEYMYNKLMSDKAFRCKDRIYPRIAYIEEYDAIMSCQKLFYKDVLTDEIIAHIRDYIIFYQRPLKSCKHLVAKCELEIQNLRSKNVDIKYAPRVAPRTSPLFQVCKIWESINNLSVKNKSNDTLHLTIEQKLKIFDFMNTHEKLKASDLRNLTGEKSREWLFANAVGNGLQGNTTYCAINKALAGCPQRDDLMMFNLTIKEGNIDSETGEIRKLVDASFVEENFYQLWHALYSISNIDELRDVLIKKFSINDEKVLDALCQLDFVKAGYGNKSSRAIRRILPYLQEGMNYHDAKLAAGYNDVTLTKEENEKRQLVEKLQPIVKGALRQPVVEKILNQLVNLVNSLMAEYGHFDEIRVELARELKQSREERELTTHTISANQKENEAIAKRIKEEYGLTPTKSRIQKYKLWQETDHTCIYCGKIVDVKEFLYGFGVEVEHIIPRSVLFDDSFSNKVCACRACNKDKGNATAFDYMRNKSEGVFNAYLDRVNDLAQRKKNFKSKRNKLLTPASELPTDFINRQLRESQYIAKKAKEMLSTICHNVYATSGSITDFIRHLWGWDEVLHNLNFNRYREAGLTEYVERIIDGKPIKIERIIGWSKRMDHRHHAIDALTIACTKQSYIQRINNLNSLKEISFQSYADDKQDKITKQRLTKLQQYIKMQPHFTTADVELAVKGIAVSFKSGKRVASIGKRYVYSGGKRRCVQEGIVIPRGSLSEDSVYGRICDSESGQQEIVIKYKLGVIKLKDVDFIVDKYIREIVRERLKKFGDKPEKAFAEPLLDHQGNEIRSVRCRTGLSSTVPLRYNQQGKPIAFVKPANNHHVAIYEDENGKLHEHIVTFWHAVERKKYGMPIIITDVEVAWDSVTDNMPESFLKQLPLSTKWKFKFSMQQNEMFVVGMNEDLYQDAMEHQDYAMLSKYLYRVQKLSHNEYCFRHHIETTVDDRYNGVRNQMLSKTLKKLIIIQSMGALQHNNLHKVQISVTGKIKEV